MSVLPKHDRNNARLFSSFMIKYEKEEDKKKKKKKHNSISRQVIAVKSLGGLPVGWSQWEKVFKRCEESSRDSSQKKKKKKKKKKEEVDDEEVVVEVEVAVYPRMTRI
ncbi:hypothetical protein M0802_010355 [Mischocyttarus mexicanus]|nr:hypothetical protein M0802_010355 [Mischocyttarus mexicanus]